MTDIPITEVFPEAEPSDDGGSSYGSEERPQSTYVEDELRREVRPQRVRNASRTPLTGLIEFVWGGIGTALVQSGVDIPVGRTMAFQAPVAGSKLEELMKGTVVDRLLQPFAAKMETTTDVGSILLLPLLVGVYWRKPEIAPAITPFLKQAVDANIDEMLPVLKKEQKKRKRTAEQLAELQELLEIPEGVDPFEAFMGSVFAPPPGYESPVPTPEPTAESAMP